MIENIQSNTGEFVFGLGVVFAGLAFAYTVLRKRPKPSELDTRYEKVIDRIYEVAGLLTDKNEEGLKKFVGDLEGLCDEYNIRKEVK
jgi:hypothetical protein